MSNQLSEAIAILRELEWNSCTSCSYDGCEHGCPVCGEDEPHTVMIPSVRIDAWTRTEARQEPRGGHKPDCRLARLLASVRHGLGEDK